jgi:hypothetical protein
MKKTRQYPKLLLVVAAIIIGSLGVLCFTKTVYASGYTGNNDKLNLSGGDHITGTLQLSKSEVISGTEPMTITITLLKGNVGIGIDERYTLLVKAKNPSCRTVSLFLVPSLQDWPEDTWTSKFVERGCMSGSYVYDVTIGFAMGFDIFTMETPFSVIAPKADIMFYLPYIGR